MTTPNELRDLDNDRALPASPDRAFVPSGSSPSVSPVPASIPSAWKSATEEFLAETEAKRVAFSERNPTLWRELLATATQPTLAVCKHLESEEADRACRCGYSGSVWADGEHILFTMGDTRDPEHPEFAAPRIERPAEIASAQLITCLFNNAAWLIELAAQAVSPVPASIPSADELVKAGTALLAVCEMTTFSDQFPAECEAMSVALAKARGAE